MDEIFKVFLTTGNSVHNTEYLAFGKAMLARLYLKVKVCITKLLSIYIYIYIYIIYNLQKTSCLKWSNFVWIFTFLRILWPWKLTFIEHWMNFNSPIMFPWYLLKLFFIRCLDFHHNWWNKRGTKINFSNVFEGCYWGKKFGNS